MRLIATAAPLLFVLAATSPAAADTLSAVDPDPGVRLTLDGATLTATLTPNAQSPAARGELFGRRVTAVCARGYAGRFQSVVTELTWPASAGAVSFRFRRDLSRRALWCLLEAPDGGDIAFARFPPRLAIRTTVRRGRQPPSSRREPVLVLKARNGDTLFERGPKLIDTRVPAGTYRLTVYSRYCNPTCGRFFIQTRSCSRRLRLLNGQLTRVRVRFTLGGACSIRVLSGPRSSR
jgi:hypothetical protein